MAEGRQEIEREVDKMAEGRQEIEREVDKMAEGGLENFFCFLGISFHILSMQSPLRDLWPQHQLFLFPEF